MTTTLTAPAGVRTPNRLRRFAPMLDQVADPLGYEAGDANLRRYVGNSPTNATDPSGLEEQRPWYNDSGWDWANPWAYPILRIVPNTLSGYYFTQWNEMSRELDMARQQKQSATQAGANGADVHSRVQDSCRFGEATRQTVEQGATISIEWLASGGMFARPQAEMATLTATQVQRTRTVWNTVENAGERYAQTAVPRYYTYVHPTRGTRIYIAPNATEHLAERSLGYLRNNPYQTCAVEQSLLITQVQMESLHSAVDAAISQGIRYNQMYRINGWELIFSAPRTAGELPALTHALYR
jgi:hypothetical protein